MKLYTKLEQQLKKEPNFVTDNGDLNYHCKSEAR